MNFICASKNSNKTASTLEIFIKKLHSFTIAPLSSKLAHKKTKIVIEILYDTDK